MTRGKTKRRTCPSRKVGYKTAGLAEAAAVRVSRAIGPVRVYLCPSCSTYHLTTIRRWKEGSS